MPEIVEMRPDRCLLNNNFEKYQLTSETIPVVSETALKTEVYRLEPNNDQESLLEARLFAYHNHLFKNPYDSSCWFVDKNFDVWRLSKTDSLDRMLSIQSDTLSSSPLYNPSIGFAFNGLSVVSDGGTCLRMIKYGEGECAKKTVELECSEPGVVLDVEYIDATSRITVAMCAVREYGNKKWSRILVLSYDYSDKCAESLAPVQREALKAQGAVEYAKLERNGDYLHCIAQDSIVFVNPKPVAEQLEGNNGKEADKKLPRYCWTQDEDSITLWIKFEPEYRSRLAMDIAPMELSVTRMGNTVIQGRCRHRLDEDLTTWKFEEDRLRIELVKYEPGQMWTELFVGDKHGEYLPNEALAAEVHTRLAHLCSEQTKGDQPCVGFNANQLEECDVKDKESILQRINLSGQECTHMAMLGSSGYVLYAYKTKEGQAVCLRHDNDGCVWEIEQNANEWGVSHRYTFPGFGYVEASKRNKKFCVAPVNGTYVAILEDTRYIFLYERPKPDAKVGKQWLLDLGPDTLPVMGAAATNRHLIVLCRNKLYRLQIYS